MNFVKALFHNHVFLGMLVALGAQIAKSHGIEIDAAGVTNDIASLVAVAVAAKGHVKTVRSDAVPPK